MLNNGGDTDNENSHGKISVTSFEQEKYITSNHPPIIDRMKMKTAEESPSCSSKRGDFDYLEVGRKTSKAIIP
jgi:hypothetical protein